jgi:hypothetical protein
MSQQDLFLSNWNQISSWWKVKMDVQMGALLNSKNKREKDMKGAFFPHDFLSYITMA